jgi:hypothetical protein
VVNISKTADERVSRYHLMFTKIGPQSRNNILLYVYNIFGEREGDDGRRMRRLNAAAAKASEKSDTQSEKPQKESEPAQNQSR